MKASELFEFRRSRCDGQDVEVRARCRAKFFAERAPKPDFIDPAIEERRCFDVGFLRGVEWGLARLYLAFAESAPSSLSPCGEWMYLLDRLSKTDPALFPCLDAPQDGLPDRPGERSHAD